MELMKLDDAPNIDDFLCVVFTLPLLLVVAPVLLLLVLLLSSMEALGPYDSDAISLIKGPSSSSWREADGKSILKL